MKLKTILLVALLAAGAAFGQAVTGENVCGVMRVDSQTANTIIAVPWVEVGSGAAVKVANLVMTDSLTVGDQLFVYDGGNWFAFILEDKNDVKTWGACTTVAGNGIPAAQGAQDKALPQGTALFLKRGNASAPIYLYGQDNAGVGSRTAAEGTAEAPAYTLLASPKAEEFNLNASGKVSGAADGDQVVVPLDGGADLIYTYNAGKADGAKWGCSVKQAVTLGGRTVQKQVWTAASGIGMGTGFWYVSKGGRATFNW